MSSFLDCVLQFLSNGKEDLPSNVSFSPLVRRSPSVLSRRGKCVLLVVVEVENLQMSLLLKVGTLEALSFR